MLPYGRHINHWLSVNFGGLRTNSSSSIENTLGMSSLLRSLGFDSKGKTFVELGSGWNGGAAMTLLGLSAKEVISYDLYRHLDPRLVELTKERFTTIDLTSRKPFPFPCNVEGELAIFDRCNIRLEQFRYLAPHDARYTGLRDNSVDCYFSQAVLEHVPKPIIQELLTESFRILRPGGVCYHYIQPTMHAAWGDSKATGIDYLTCADWAWSAFYSNDISHECRLRGTDHISLIRDAGFDIMGEWHTIDKEAFAALPGMTLARRFRSYCEEDICTNYIWIVGRKPSDCSQRDAQIPRSIKEA